MTAFVDPYIPQRSGFYPPTLADVQRLEEAWVGGSVQHTASMMGAQRTNSRTHRVDPYSRLSFPLSPNATQQPQRSGCDAGSSHTAKNPSSQLFVHPRSQQQVSKIIFAPSGSPNTSSMVAGPSRSGKHGSIHLCVLSFNWAAKPDR